LGLQLKREADMTSRAKDKRRKVLAKRAAADVMTVEDVAARLGIGRNQAYEAVARGQVPGAFRFGRRWLIPRVAFDRMLQGDRSSPAADESRSTRLRKAAAADNITTV
jgi:excisionase family DNA binding protein